MFRTTFEFVANTKRANIVKCGNHTKNRQPHEKGNHKGLPLLGFDG